MMKWLRKYSKQIMVALVLIAMFSFVGGTALTNLLQPKGNTVFATAFGKDLSYKENNLAQRDINVYEKLGVPWQFGGEKMQSYHWYLLIQEAENAGLVVSDVEVDKMLDSLAQSGMDARFFQVLRTRFGLAMPDIRQALKDHLLVQKNTSRVVMAAAPSESELRHFARDTEEKVRVRYVSLDASSFVDKDQPVAEAEAQALFDKYKEVNAGEGAEGWGYRLPRRVKVEYLIAVLQRIQAEVPVSFDEMKDYWQKNKSKYRKMDYVDDVQPTTSAASTEPASTQPTSQAAKKQVEREKAFSEARQDVERDLRTQKAARLADQAMRKATSLLMEPWDKVKSDPETGFKPIPPEVQAPDFMKKIGEAVSKEVGVTLLFNEAPLSSQEKLGEWADLRGAALPGKGQERITLAQYAFNIPPFLKREEIRDAGAALQLYQTPDTSLTAESAGSYRVMDGRLVQTPGATERLILFRVVEAREAGVPENLAEVRADVDRDVKLARAYEAIKPITEELFVATQRLGLEKALDLFDDLRDKHGIKKPLSPPAFTRRTSLAKGGDNKKYGEALRVGAPTLICPTISGLGVCEEFVGACFEMIQPAWQPPAVQAATTDRLQAATTRPAASPTPLARPLDLPKRHQRMVVELLSVEPVDDAKYETQLKEAAYNTVSDERVGILSIEWYKPEQIEKRCGFKVLRQGRVGETDEGVQPVIPPSPPPEQAPVF
jgi:hypothetical protein